MIEKIFNKWGYTKTARIVEMVRGEGKYPNYDTPVTQPDYRKLEKKYGTSLWVYACVFCISNNGASLPLKIKNKKNEEVLDHPVLDLIKNPNDYMTGYDMLEWIFMALELTGNGYLLMDKRGANDKPKELHPLISSMVTIKKDENLVKNETPKLVGMYQYTASGEKKDYKPEEVLHWRYANPRSLRYGLSAMSASLPDIDTMAEMVKDAKKLFENPAIPDGLLESDKKIPSEAKAAILTAWYKKYQGTENAHQIGIADYGLKFRDLRKSQHDIQYIESRKLIREEICSGFGVPPALVGLFEHSNYANAPAQREIFWIDTMLPKLKKVIPLFQRLLDFWDKDYTIYFDTSNVKALRKDEKSQGEIAKIYFSMGVPINDIIKKLDLPFTEVVGGDIGYLPLGLIPTGTPRQPPTPKPARTVEDTVELIEEEIKKFKEKPKSSLSDDAKRQIWDVMVKSTERQESLMKPKLKGIFTELKKQVFNVLDKFKSEGFYETSRGKMEKVKCYDCNTRTSLFAGVELFNFDKIRDDYFRIVSEAGLLAIEEAVEREANLLGLKNASHRKKDFDFNYGHPAVTGFLQTEGLKKSTLWTTNIKKELKVILIESIDEGLGIIDIRKRMSAKVFADSVVAFKVERIARTEIMMANNFGAEQLYIQSAVVQSKEWLTSFDEDTCDDCEIMDGTIAELGKSFEVEGVGADMVEYPSLHPNCRCVLIPVV